MPRSSTNTEIQNDMICKSKTIFLIITPLIYYFFRNSFNHQNSDYGYAVLTVQSKYQSS